MGFSMCFVWGREWGCPFLHFVGGAVGWYLAMRITHRFFDLQSVLRRVMAGLFVLRNRGANWILPGWLGLIGGFFLLNWGLRRR